jgi:hypothetical protein
MMKYLDYHPLLIVAMLISGLSIFVFHSKYSAFAAAAVLGVGAREIEYHLKKERSE